MKFKNPQSVIFWNMKEYDVRRATATRHNVKQPEQTKEFKQLKNKFNAGKIESFGWSVWRPGPGQDPNVKPGTPVITIL